jgi:hypothetical protein
MQIITVDYVPAHYYGKLKPLHRCVKAVSYLLH